jgi:hypothetical protein
MPYIMGMRADIYLVIVLILTVTQGFSYHSFLAALLTFIFLCGLAYINDALIPKLIDIIRKKRNPKNDGFFR